jgi:hypothetical protein
MSNQRERGCAVPIATDAPRSPGWWLKRLFNMLNDRDRRRRLQLLYDYHRGNAPLPEGADNAREAFEAFQRKSRSNFAELVVSAMSERMMPVGFRTALDDDATGDAEVGRLWRRAGLDVVSADVHDWMFALSESYVIVGAVDEETGAPLITAEDPRWMVGEPDPANPRRLLAALKVMHDDADDEDRAYLFLPGQVFVAVRQQTRYDATISRDLERRERVYPSPGMWFDGKGWDWSEERSGTLPHGRIPVVRFLNKYSKGEFEIHTDTLDRINKQILDRMVIATMQAFRQRAVRGLPLTYPDDHPAAGQVIDYSQVFTADPAAMWMIPETAQMWESGQVDLRPILEAVKSDLEHLASATRTPLHMLSAAGVNQSAEGASLAREGLVFKVEDRIGRCSYPWAQVMSLALIHAGQPERADMATLETLWAPANRLSLAERADAASKLVDLLPKRTLFIKVLGMSPDEADRTMTELTEEQLLNAQVQQALLAVAPDVAQEPAAGQPASRDGAEQPESVS